MPLSCAPFSFCVKPDLLPKGFLFFDCSLFHIKKPITAKMPMAIIVDCWRDRPGAALAVAATAAGLFSTGATYAGEVFSGFVFSVALLMVDKAKPQEVQNLKSG